MEHARGNTKSRAYILVVNNYIDTEWNTLYEDFSTKSEFYIIGKEVGEQGTPHLQCYVRFKNPRHFSAMKKLVPRAHIEKAKANDDANFLYCSKGGDFVTNKAPSLNDKLLKKYDNVVWKDWQQQLLNIIDNNEPDDRTIHWVHDKEGNKGKSFLVKYIYLKYPGLIIADGKKDNVYNQVFTMMENDIEPKIIILDVPRSNQKYVNYAVLENLKNGLIYSGKYEGGICAFEHPHVIVMSNEAPITGEFSEDRIHLIKI